MGDVGPFVGVGIDDRGVLREQRCEQLLDLRQFSIGSAIGDCCGSDSKPERRSGQYTEKNHSWKLPNWRCSEFCCRDADSNWNEGNLSGRCERRGETGVMLHIYASAKPMAKLMAKPCQLSFVGQSLVE